MRHTVKLKLAHEIFEQIAKPYATRKKVVEHLSTTWKEQDVQTTIDQMIQERLLATGERTLKIVDEAFARQIATYYSKGPNA